jgi:hypothetical protein
MAVVLTAILYFAMVFAFAFAMGVARVLVIAPRLGESGAVCLEVPILLTASWLVARRLLRDQNLGFPQRFAVGGIAFVCTMASEAVLAGLIRGQSVSEWAAGLATPLGFVGLAGQLGFAAMPLFVGRIQPRHSAK